MIAEHLSQLKRKRPDIFEDDHRKPPPPPPPSRPMPPRGVPPPPPPPKWFMGKNINIYIDYLK